MADMEKKHKNNQNQIWKIATVVCVVLAVVALGIFGVRKIQQGQREAELAQLASRNTIPAETQTPQSTEPSQASTAAEEPSTGEPDILEELSVPIPEKEVDFEKLQAETNKDIYAWIYLPDSMIDYPVLQHPSNNTYYLEYNLDGSKGYPGCIYTENYNKKDFSDPVTVMYGHNMKSGAMFAGLHKFEDAEYFEQHPYVYVYTPEKMLVYRIFAASEYSDKHILLNYDFKKDGAVNGFLAEVTSSRSMGNHYNEEVEIDPENSHILVLSTCISKKPNNRYLVLGVLLNED